MKLRKRKKSAYAKKLDDPRWLARRIEILQRDKLTCCDCGSTSKPIHVHHVIYHRGKQPWEYGDELLRTLCEDCHELRHAEQQRLLVALSKKPIRTIQNIISSLGPRTKEAAEPQAAVSDERTREWFEGLRQMLRESA